MKNLPPCQLINTGGEVSAIVNVQKNLRNQAQIARRIMANNRAIEQVGFLNPLTNTFRMMGGELSVNGLAATAFDLMSKRRESQIMLETNVCNQPIRANLKNGAVTVILPKSLIKTMKDSTIILDGMTFLLIPNPPSRNTVTKKQKTILRTITEQSTAAGLVYYRGATIKPLIYVKETNSFVWEESCGSGSIAYALFSSRKRIRQPSGKTVTVTITKTNICYRTSVWYDQKEAI